MAESKFPQMPIELLHLLAFELGVLSALDVLNIALTSKAIGHLLLGTEFDRIQHRALTGVHQCAFYLHDRAAILALRRGFGEIISKKVGGRSDFPMITSPTIHVAVYNGLVELTSLLVADPRVDPSVHGNLAIRTASRIGMTEITTLLLADPRVSPSELDNEAICSACTNGHAETATLLLADPRVDPADLSNKALRMAAQNGHAEAVKLLLADPRVDPTDVDNCAYWIAQHRGHTEVVALLLADPRVSVLEQ